ncbi:hypothetical protein C8F04DRAFT_1186355 [Mycena alexandri]|uniref:Uncharacterized protein n=1 Tax=Mycena alexandri TaxID=1745969 RepID=A0AAD6WXB1_9AGAR|nr:hypothetical protein C8F04DRAFT_1186355 [Mycena alexandri]
MPDASTQTDVSLFHSMELRSAPPTAEKALHTVEPKAGAPPTADKSLEYKRGSCSRSFSWYTLKFEAEAIAHVKGQATGPPTAGMVHWLGKTITRPHIASEFDNLSPAELLAHEELRKKKVAELLRLREGYKERLRKEPYLHWRPPKKSEGEGN